MHKFEYNLTMDELKKRTSDEYLITKKFLTPESEEYLRLDDKDKKALRYLVKAADCFDDIYMRLDSYYNLEIKKFLDDEIAKGSERAKLTKVLFDAQKGASALDRETKEVNLFKDIKLMPGKGFYPEDLSKDEFFSILTDMINSGKQKEVSNLLNQRTVVIRDGKALKGIDYTEYFKNEFNNIANLLEEASKISTNADFNEYLKLQVKALRNNDPMLDAYADKKWASLQDTPLEFTITRESYQDEMTSTIIENKELSVLLERNNINAYPKDSLGCRVGIVNNEGTNLLLSIKKYLPIIAKKMPYQDEYTQIINNDNKQTMVDVDVIILGGDAGTYRSGITTAENLPNDDKMSLTIGGGRRNCYHRQIRAISDKMKLQKRLDEILDKSQHTYYSSEAEHWFTIGHENAHSLGPKNGLEKLGLYRNIIEENKADMGSIAFVDLLVEQGMYTKEQRDQIIVSFVVDLFLKAKPSLSQAHRVRTVMQNKYFKERDGFKVTNDGKIFVNIDKVPKIAYEMLSEIIRIQIDKDMRKAEKYVNDNFIWTKEMEIIASNLQKVDKALNGRVEAELADKLLSE